MYYTFFKKKKKSCTIMESALESCNHDLGFLLLIVLCLLIFGISHVLVFCYDFLQTSFCYGDSFSWKILAIMLIMTGPYNMF